MPGPSRTPHPSPAQLGAGDWAVLTLAQPNQPHPSHQPDPSPLSNPLPYPPPANHPPDHPLPDTPDPPKQDVEGYAAASVSGGPSRLSAAQLGRLHAVLSPFMLRRVKADVLEVGGWGALEGVWGHRGHSPGKAGG
jgi:hypothetical protein